MAESIFPFLPNGASAPPQTFPYDVVISDAFPGIQFIPLEPNGEYQEIREVSGNLWLVTNAMWNANLLQWDQESLQNTGLPAYALELGADGSMTRWESPPTNIPLTPITWTRLFQVDNKGQVISVPLTVLTANQASQQIFVVWDPGIGTQVEGRLLQVTDVASASNSLLDNLVVNGNSKWAVDKSGTLVTGIIPVARITGLVPFPGFNNATFTGTTTFNGPVVDNSTLDVFGAATFHSSLTADSTFFAVGLATLNSHANVNSGLTVTGGESVTGGLTTDTLHVTGISTLDGAVTANNTLAVVGHTQLANVTLNAGDVISVNGTTPVVLLESTNGSIGVSQVSNHEYDLSVLTAPIAPGSSYVNTAFFPLGSTNGTISLGPLPGTAANTFRIIYWGALQFQNASRELTVTGVVSAGITWDVASQQYENSNSGTFPFMYFGTAEGGTTPTINWTCNDVIAFTPMFTTIMASIQL